MQIESFISTCTTVIHVICTPAHMHTQAYAHMYTQAYAHMHTQAYAHMYNNTPHGYI